MCKSDSLTSNFNPFRFIIESHSNSPFNFLRTGRLYHVSVLSTLKMKSNSLSLTTLAKVVNCIKIYSLFFMCLSVLCTCMLSPHAHAVPAVLEQICGSMRAIVLGWGELC